MGFGGDIFSGVASIFSPDPKNTSTEEKYTGQTMSPQEQHLYDVLTQMLEKQQGNLDNQTSQYTALQPELYSNVRGLDTSGADINSMFAGRTLKALRGELPDDPGLLRQLSIGDITTQDTLRKNLGSGYATSTPGIQAMNDWEQRKQELLYNARKSDMQDAFANYQSGTSNLFTRQLQKVGALGAVPTGALPFVSAGNSLTGAVAAPLNTFAKQQTDSAATGQKYFEDKLAYRGSMMKSIASLFGGVG